LNCFKALRANYERFIAIECYMLPGVAKCYLLIN